MSALPFLLALLAQSPDAGAAPPDAGSAPEAESSARAPELLSLSPEARRAAVKAMSKEERERFLQSTPSEQLIAMGARTVAGLGVYQFVMTKQERIDGELRPLTTADVFVREKPFAVRMHFTSGPGAGRRLVFNPSVRKDEFRVREVGIASILGRLWINVDSNLAKKDSRRTIREAGMGNLVTRLKADFDRAAPSGGFAVTHEGWDSAGRYCSMYLSPNGGKGFDNVRTRICTDLEAGLPGKIDGYDEKGALLSHFEFSAWKSAALADEFFDSDKAGL
jgi:hypothetical protein